jgi:hypothetical protein
MLDTGLPEDIAFKTAQARLAKGCPKSIASRVQRAKENLLQFCEDCAWVPRISISDAHGVISLIPKLTIVVRSE